MVKGTRRRLLALTLAVLVVLAGCSGGGGDAMEGETVVEDAGSEASAEQTVAAESAKEEAQGQNAQIRQRALIRTGTVAVEVVDYDDARRNLTRETRRLGGFVSDSGQRVHTEENRSWTTGKLVLRVPRENFSALLSRTKRAGEVRKANTNTEDVTKQLVDIEARLKNLKAQRDRLRKLYQEANDTENVLEVQERLSEVQTEIEQLEARRKALKRQVAYSTITVRLNEPRPEPTTDRTDTDRWYETGLAAAFLSSVNGVVVVTRGLAVGLAYALPYLLVFGVPLGGAFAVWRRRRSGDAGPDLPDVPESGGASDSGDEDD